MFTVYKTMSGEYRSYIKNHAEVQSWGFSEYKSLVNLQKQLCLILDGKLQSSMTQDEIENVSLSIGERLEYLS